MKDSRDLYDRRYGFQKDMSTVDAINVAVKAARITADHIPDT